MPFRLSRRTPPIHTAPAPLLGQHNHELLIELGLSDSDIEELLVAGVIGSAPPG